MYDMIAILIHFSAMIQVESTDERRAELSALYNDAAAAHFSGSIMIP